MLGGWDVLMPFFVVFDEGRRKKNPFFAQAKKSLDQASSL